jgi:hypothetical protein
VAVHRKGTVTMVSGSLPPGYESVATTPALADAEAAAKVTQLQAVKDSRSKVQGPTPLVIWWDQYVDQAPPARLAYVVHLDRPAKDGTGTYVVDAQSGGILKRQPAVRRTGAPVPAVAHERAAATGPRAAVTGTGVPRQLTLEVKARARTGHAANGAVTEVPLPGVKIDGYGVTDVDGRITVNVTEGTVLTTDLTGDYCQAFAPSCLWCYTVGAHAPGAVVTFPVMDPVNSFAVVDHATVIYWVKRGYESLVKWLPELTLADVAPLSAYLANPVPCYAGCDEDRQIMYFSGDGDCCRSFVFASIILHELGHAVEHVFVKELGKYGDYGDHDVREAVADMVSMFVLDEPEIGDRFSYEHEGCMRTGDNDIQQGYSSSVAYGHPGECLIGFAWHAYEEFAKTGDTTFVKNRSSARRRTIPTRSTRSSPW